MSQIDFRLRRMPALATHCLRSRTLFALAAASVVFLTGPGCRTAPKATTSKTARMTIARSSFGAIREAIAHRMRAYDWVLVKQEAAAVVFEKPLAAGYDYWVSNGERKLVVLSAQFTLEAVADGVEVQASQQRIDRSKVPPRITVEAPKEPQNVLNEVQRLLGSAGSAPK